MSHPLGCVIDWKMVLKKQSGDINNDRTANMTQIQKLVVEGPKAVLHPQDINSWVRVIDTFANKLDGHVSSTTVIKLTVPTVLSFFRS